MKESLAIIAIVLAICGCDTSHPGSDADQPSSQHRASLVIENVVLVDSRTGEATAGVTIRVKGDRIVSIDEASTGEDGIVIDGEGKWVIPGLIDVHVHEGNADYLSDMLAWGVTSIFLMPRVPPDDPLAVERESERAQSRMPRQTLSEMFTAAFPDNQLPGVYQFIKPQTADEARSVVQNSFEKGYRTIKIIRDNTVAWSGEAYRAPLMPQSVYDALVTQARSLDMRVYVHAAERAVAREALPLGADAFIHSVMDEELNSDDVAMMIAATGVWAPTVNAPLSFGDQKRYAGHIMADARFAPLFEEDELALWTNNAVSDQPIFLPQMAHLVANTQTYLDTISKNTRASLDAGVEIAVGTDGGPGGVSTQLELEFLSLIGLEPKEILRAATLGGAIALGRDSEIGSIEVGKLADMIILSADPLADIKNCRSIEWVIKGGEVFRPIDLALSN